MGLHTDAHTHTHVDMTNTGLPPRMSSLKNSCHSLTEVKPGGKPCIPSCRHVRLSDYQLIFMSVPLIFKALAIIALGYENTLLIKMAALRENQKQSEERTG